MQTSDERYFSKKITRLQKYASTFRPPKMANTNITEIIGTEESCTFTETLLKKRREEEYERSTSN